MKVFIAMCWAGTFLFYCGVALAMAAAERGLLGSASEPTWPGPDWSQAPADAVAWAWDREVGAAWFTGEPEFESHCNQWCIDDDYSWTPAPTFSYQGKPEDSLRRRPA